MVCIAKLGPKNKTKSILILVQYEEYVLQQFTSTEQLAKPCVRTRVFFLFV